MLSYVDYVLVMKICVVLVLTWEGKKTEMNIETEREMYTPNYKDGWYDGYEQEIDEGKVRL